MYTKFTCLRFEDVFKLEAINLRYLTHNLISQLIYFISKKKTHISPGERIRLPRNLLLIHPHELCHLHFFKSKKLVKSKLSLCDISS